MALTHQRKTQLLQMDLPDDAEMMRRTRLFQLRSGLSTPDLAAELQIGDSSLHLYLNGRYGAHCPTPGNANTMNLRARLKEYIDLHDLKHRTRLRGRHCDTADYKRVRQAVWDAMTNGLPYTISGAPGTQKTWSLLNVAREINASGKGRAIYIYVRDGMRPQSFLRELCHTAELPDKGQIDALVRKLQYFLAAEPTVLLIDEGNHLDQRTMEIVRQLGDNPPYFGVVTAGSHEYANRLNDYRLGQLQSRNQDTLVLEGPSRAEARTILATRLGFGSDDADAVIADCMAQADRAVTRNDRQVAEKFSYISARKLFDAIEAVAPMVAKQQQQEEVAQ